MVTADPADTGSDTTTPYDPSDPPPDLPPTPQWYPPGTRLSHWSFSGGLGNTQFDDSGELDFTGSTNWTTDPMTLDQALAMIQGTISSDDGGVSIDGSGVMDYSFPDDASENLYYGAFWINRIADSAAEIRFNDSAYRVPYDWDYSDGDWFLTRDGETVGADDPPPDTQGSGWTPTGTPAGKPYVWISGTTDSDPSSATFTVSRYGDTSEDLTVQLFPAAGDAAQQDGVIDMPSSVTIPAGDSSASFSVTAGSTEPADLNVVAILKADSAYWLGAAFMATTQVLVGQAFNVMGINLTVSHVYSNQTPGNVANSLPDNTGNGNKYMLMGALANNTASVRLEMAIGGQPPAGLLFAFYDPSDPALAPVGATGVAASTGIQTLTLNSNAVQGTTDAADMWIGYGIDTNNDGSLEKNEILGSLPYDIKVVSTVARQGAIDYLNGYLTGVLGGLASHSYPIASNWLYCFLTDQGLRGATNVLDSISTADNRLSHHVGAVYSGQTAPINKAVFDSSSDVAIAICNSDEFRQMVHLKLLSNAAAIVGAIGSSSSWTSFTVPWPSDSIVFDEGDLSIAIHGADLHGLSLTGSARVVNVLGDSHLEIEARVTGQLTDLYDFNYDDGGKAQKAAMVEAGFSSAGQAGHIFKVEVNFDTSILLGTDFIDLH